MVVIDAIGRDTEKVWKKETDGANIKRYWREGWLAPSTGTGEEAPAI